MAKQTVTKPESYRDVMVTFNKMQHKRDKGYILDAMEKVTVTKRGFFSNDGIGGFYDKADKFITMPDGYFSVPQEYREFKGVLLPHGFSSDRVTLEDVISWEYVD